jgi:tetratricopeptide (TPR) repeat protein
MTHDTSPAMAEHLLSVGTECSIRGDFQGALVCFERVRTAQPLDPKVHARLGATLALMSRLPEALLRYQDASRLAPQNAEYQHDLGFVLERLYRPEEAVVCYRRAVALNPQSDGSFNNLASALVTLGQFPEAHAAYREAIRLAPNNMTYYRNLVQSKKLVADDPCFIAMSERVKDCASLTPENQAQLHFALGQALEDLGQSDLSFEHFVKANALVRQRVAYNEASTFNLFDNVKATQGAGLFARKHVVGDPSDTPIFIVGMPRSGSTLIEQILASHPQVFGAGERPTFAQVLSARIARPPGDTDRIDIERLDAVSADQWTALGADYLRHMRASISDARGYQRITDKYPFNFMHLGLIHLALPNARFIHARRSPVDTCLSSFSRIFRDVPFSYDLGELGRYYRAYDSMMAHWRAVLPEGVMLEVQYEDVVTDLEPNVQRMLAHCNLPWDDRCVAFHQTKRQVVTASALQVRMPLYQSSRRRWRPLQTLLQPLLDGLGPTLCE